MGPLSVLYTNYRRTIGKVEANVEIVKPKPRGRPREGVREAVLDAATQLFIERDYADVSTEDVIERAGVSRGAMYHHFSGKEDLFLAVYEASERRAMERIAGAGLEADGAVRGRPARGRGAGRGRGCREPRVPARGGDVRGAAPHRDHAEPRRAGVG